MTDPKRLLDEVEAGSLEHELLALGQRLEPPPGAIEQGWAGVSAAIGGLGSAAGGAAGGGGTLQMLASAGAVKALLIGAALGTGVVSSVPLVRWAVRDEPRAASPSRAPRPLPSVAPAMPPAVPAALETDHEPPLTPAPAVPPPAPASAERSITPGSDTAVDRGGAAAPVAPALAPPRPAPDSAGNSPGPLPEVPTASSTPPQASAVVDSAPSGLRAEALELAKARNLLESGQTSGALALLGSSQQRFAGGALVQEREALIIDALLRRGDDDAARQRAGAFLSRYPNSPLADKIRSIHEKLAGK